MPTPHPSYHHPDGGIASGPVLVGPDSASRGRAEPPTMRQRSEWLGRALAFRSDGPHPLVWIHDVSDARVDGSAFADAQNESQRISELLNQLLPQPIAHEVGFSRPTWLETIQPVYQWLHTNTVGWDASIREACLLKPIVPLYLAKAATPETQQDAYSAARLESSQLLMELIGLVSMGRVLDASGFGNWLENRSGMVSDPWGLVTSAFRVQLDTVVGAMVERMFDHRQIPRPTTGSMAAINERDHQRWWKLAWQWSRSTANLRVPDGLPITVVPWRALVAHWKVLYAMLCGEHSTGKANFVEVRDASDAQLGNMLERWLGEIRSHQGTLSILAVRWAGDDSVHPKPIEAVAWWQTQWTQCLLSSFDVSDPRGFVTESGDFAMYVRDIDRIELGQIVREAMSKMQLRLIESRCLSDHQPLPMMAGIASVHAPAKSFRIDQLMDATWRCLDGAQSQGAGAVKSIEVY